MLNCLTRVLIFFIIVSTLPIKSYAFLTVKNLRTYDHEDFTRFVLEFNNKAKMKVINKSDDNYFVINIHNVSEAANLQTSLKSNKIIVKKTSLKNQVLTIILKAQSNIKIKKIFYIAPNEKYPYRAVIDFTEKNDGISDFDAVKKAIEELNNQKTIPQPVSKPKKYRPLIIIDAGHGGHDPGTIGKKGTKEKYITLLFSKSLAKALSENDKYRVFLTRKTDKFISLEDRVKIAKKKQGDLFISIHADAHNKPEIKGLSIYTLSQTASDKEAEELAKRENHSGVIKDSDLKDDVVATFLIDLVQRDALNKSASFAETLVKTLKPNINLLENCHRFAGFKVLTNTTMPSVLIELGYLSNRTEEHLLRNLQYREKIVNLIVETVNIYFNNFE